MANLKKPTINDMVNFITSQGNNEIPENFIVHKNIIKRYIEYLFEYFWNFPKIVEYLNKYNRLTSDSFVRMQEQPFEYLKMLKYICNTNKIFKYQLKNNFFNFKEAKDKIILLENEALINNEQLIDTIACKKLERLIFNGSPKTLKAKQIKDKNEKENIKKVVDNIYNEHHENEKIKKQKKLLESGKFLSELNDKIVEQLRLTLIDTFVDEKHNKTIYIFIDKDFQKRYFVENFEAEIYISKSTSIIDNDYLNPAKKDNFIKYKIINHWDYKRLKNAIKKNYENFMKQNI